jgi:C-terminal processing protease CtpA/Prc
MNFARPTTELEEDMPAKRAGVLVGDSVLEVDGKPVPGARASKIRPLLERPPGETVVFKLLRASGETYVVTLTSVSVRQR